MPTIQFFQPHEGRRFDGPLDLNERLVRHPTATFFMRAEAESRELGVRPGDLLVIDRSLEAAPGRAAVVVRAGDLKAERLRFGAEEIEVWGVITHVIRKL